MYFLSYFAQMKLIVCVVLLLTTIYLPGWSQVPVSIKKNNQTAFTDVMLPPWQTPSILHLPIKKNRLSLLIEQGPQLNNVQPPTAFFCRIEDAIAKSSKVNMKFRLGSVQYVDAMEGKGYFEALSYSKATNYYLSRKN